MTISSCRFCAAPLEHLFADLGLSPIANAYISPEHLSDMQPFLPLCAWVCSACFLVQLEDHGRSPSDLFSDYSYFSSFSTTWLEHARRYVALVIDRFELGSDSTVIEIASNDGYLLRNFVEAGIGVLGIEPAANVAAVAEAQGVRTLVRFFGRETAAALRDECTADLLVANNVLAHVPDLNDFVAGLGLVLAPHGVITLEFPHLQRLLEDIQFDTIYHEHFSYFSLSTADRILRAHGLVVFDVEELPTHGGSLRIYARHAHDTSRPVVGRVHELLAREIALGYDSVETYLAFSDRVKHVKRQLLTFFVDAKERGYSIVGYGAPAKANTLLNYCGLGTDFIDYTVDRSPHKQGHYLPGTRIPILAPSEIARTRPDFLFILPWNLQDEIMEQMHEIRDWGGRFVVHSPRLRVIP